MTFTHHHARTRIEKKVHANDVQLARGQTEWDIDPTWFKERKAKYVYYPKRESQYDISATPELSIGSTDSENQTLAKLKKKLKQKSKTSVSEFCTENMPLAKVKQRLQ